MTVNGTLISGGMRLAVARKDRKLYKLRGFLDRRTGRTGDFY